MIWFTEGASSLLSRRFLDFFVDKLYQVTFLNSKKIDKSNKKLLELRIRSVEEESKQQKPDGENTEKNFETHIMKDKVWLLECFRFSRFYFSIRF